MSCRNLFALMAIPIFTAGLYDSASAQSAIRQLETMTNSRIDRYSYSSGNYNSSSASNYSWQQRMEDLQAKRAERAKECFENGNAAFNQRNWEAAIRYYRKGLRKEQNSFYQGKLNEAERNKQYEEDQDKALQERIKRQEAERKRQEEEARRQQQLKEEQERQEREAIRDKLVEAEKKIVSLKKDIRHIQGFLKIYSQSLHNNVSEFEKWGSTVDEAYKNVLENTKGYGANLFIKYGLLKCLEPRMQQAVYKKLGEIIGSSNPQWQKWLAKESLAAGIDIDAVQDMADRINLLGDEADLLKGDKKGIRRNLDVALFLNGLLETAHLNSYDNLVKMGMPFGADKMPGEYFEQAKMIGETYTDLTAICYSWFSINRLNADTEKMAQQVNTLSFSMEYKMKQIDCLEDCMKKYTDRCVDKCTGKTRYSTPPPPFF